MPRIFEKIYTAATSAVEKEGGLKKRIFDWAIGVGKKVRALERAGQAPEPAARHQYKLADKQVLSKIRGLFGGNLKLAVTGAAPINPEILEFFDAAGVLVVEGWGMTETSTAATISTPRGLQAGAPSASRSPAARSRSPKTARSSSRAPNIFQGYYKNEEATAETIVDGWLHTGDIGEIDRGRLPEDHGAQEGHHHHRGRQEHHPGESRGADQAAPAGLAMRRHRRSAPVPGRPRHARPRGGRQIRRPARGRPRRTARRSRRRGLDQAHVNKINEKFARVEQVKKIKILPADLSQEGGELTPTMKVKRNVVADKYATEVEALYEK